MKKFAMPSLLRPSLPPGERFGVLAEFPSPTALSTATAPPCSSARSFTIAKPSPVPSNFRARPPSI